MKVATRAGLPRASRTGPSATRRSARRKKITVFHKANIMKMTDGMFLDEARKVHEQDYPNIDYEELIIDAGCMRLVQDPTQFDVLLCENLYGDIVSRPVRRPGRRARRRAGRQHRRRRRGVRGRARLGARHRRQGHRQPAGAVDERRDDAQPPRRHARATSAAGTAGAAHQRRPTTGARGRRDDARPRRQLGTDAFADAIIRRL